MARRVFFLALLAAAALAQDTDGDGLSDFEERHKYFTDPSKADSDGDGTPDGDWAERREFTYSIRTVVLVMKPAEAIRDDYQDARLLEDTGDLVKLEVVHYPLNTVAEAIEGRRDWRAEASARTEDLAPGLTANWDAELQAKILAGLRENGIDPEAMDDRAFVTKAAAWLVARTRDSQAFTGYFTHFPDGKPAVYPGLAAAFKGYDRAGRPIEEQWERDLFAKQTFLHGTRGSCTSSAIYLTGCLRAAGVPTRIVYCIPCIDPTDPAERAMLDGIRHHGVRSVVKQGMPSGGWGGHTFSEVLVGGRWGRLNYGTLGQNILDRSCFGLLTHVLTVRDWADAEVAATVGRRQGGGSKDDALGHGNPYSTLELDDLFGPHGKIENPAVEEPTEHDTLTVVKALWYADRPKGVESSNLDPKSGHVYVQVAENRDGSTRQYAAFYRGCSKEFVLRAEGHPDVPIRAERGYWGSGLFYLRIAPEELERMASGVSYDLVPLNGEATRAWTVREGVRLERALDVLTIDDALWSDSPRLPNALRRHFADRLVLLARVREPCTAAVFEGFLERADRRFTLLSEGGEIALAASRGAVLTDEGERYLVLVPEKPLGEGAEAALVPRNENGDRRWRIAFPIPR